MYNISKYKFICFLNDNYTNKYKIITNPLLRCKGCICLGHLAAMFEKFRSSSKLILSMIWYFSKEINSQIEHFRKRKTP